MRPIDADELKKEMESSKYIIPNDLNRLLNSEINRCIEAIDNAPTVELPQVVLFAENITEEEKQKLIAEFKAVMDNAKFTVEPERPQGAWNYIQAGMAVCPFCGANPHKDYKNFCPKCGASMVKGGEE